MRHLTEILAESKKDKEKAKKIVFVETDPREAFPSDTISAMERDVHKKAKDLEKQWTSSIELVDAVFEELEVPKPAAYQDKRWEQYKELLSFAIKALYDARGLRAGWSKTI